MSFLQFCLKGVTWAILTPELSDLWLESWSWILFYVECTQSLCYKKACLYRQLNVTQGVYDISFLRACFACSISSSATMFCEFFKKKIPSCVTHLSAMATLHGFLFFLRLLPLPFYGRYIIRFNWVSFALCALFEGTTHASLEYCSKSLQLLFASFVVCMFFHLTTFGKTFSSIKFSSSLASSIVSQRIFLHLIVDCVPFCKDNTRTKCSWTPVDY